MVDPQQAVGTDAPTVADVLAATAERLDRAGVASPRADARWLVRHALGLSPADLVREAGRPLDARAASAVRRLTDRRAAREPLQLVVGGTEFRGHPLTLRAGVFIPRPETELLVEHALRRLPDGGVAVEPCTGSGAVACAIGVERRDVQLFATDIDPAAISLASANAARLGVVVHLGTGDLFDPVPTALRGRVDVLVANPPYLATGEVADLPPEVVEWDPALALVAGPSGHEISDRLIMLAAVWLRPGGWMLLELDERRVDATARRAQAAGLTDVDTAGDLAGRPRFVRARRP